MSQANGESPDLSEQLALMPIIGWVFHSERSAEMDRHIQSRLRSVGLKPEHFHVMRQLDIQCNANIAWWLEMKERKQEMFNVLEVLRRAKLDKDAMSSISVRQLTQLRMALQSFPPEKLGEGWVIGVAKTLMTESLSHDDKAILAEAMQWRAQEAGNIGSRSWKKIRDSYLQSMSWTLPVTTIPERIGGVLIESLTSGKMVMEEGQRMRNCLSARLAAYVSSCIVGHDYLFHLRDEKHELICATLLVGKAGDEKSWSIREFESVGGGKPPPHFLAAAEAVLETFNLQASLGIVQSGC